MSDIRTEKTFETAIIESLVEQGEYGQGNAEDYRGVPPSFQLLRIN